MKLAKVSEDLLDQTFTHWNVPRDYSTVFRSYLVYGYLPGSFFTAVLANDFITAITRSNLQNDIGTLQNVAGWITEFMPREAYGNYDNVYRWSSMHDDQRRLILEKRGLIYSLDQEVWKTLVR